MASCTIRRRKDGTRYVLIRHRPSHAGSEYSKIYDFPQTWSDTTALKKADKIAQQFAEDCRARKIKPKQNRGNALQEASTGKDTRTVKGYAENVYLPRLALKASHYTLDCYTRHFKNHIFPAFGNLDIEKVTPAQINALLLDLQGKGYKVASCEKVYTVLQGLFGAAFDDEAIYSDPMQRVKRPKPTATEGIKTTPPAYTAEEVQAIIKASDGLPVKWRALFWLLCETGCRRGEALGLRWSDIDRETGGITFDQALGYTDAKGFFTKPPKNGRARTVYASPALIALFDDLRKEQEAETGKDYPGIAPHSKAANYVFQKDATGSPIRPDYVTEKFRRFGESNGIDNLHPHKLRHSFASIAIERGADIAATSAALGHTNPATTMRIYAHANTEAVKRAGSLVQDAISRKG